MRQAAKARAKELQFVLREGVFTVQRETQSLGFQGRSAVACKLWRPAGTDAAIGSVVLSLADGDFGTGDRIQFYQ